jgi:chitinase
MPKNIDPNLCTHINIGIVKIANCTLNIDEDLEQSFKEVDILRKQNKDLKILLWVGGAGDSSNGFKEMVANHANRKVFIRSLKNILETYYLDGIDLDWGEY